MSNSTGTLGLALVAVVIGLVGTYGVRTVLHQEQPAPPKPQMVTVPLATTDLPAGRTIALGDVGLVPMTREAMKEKELPLTTMMMAPEQIIGRTLRAPIKQGQPFETTSLYLEGTKPNVAEKLKPGFRAASLQLPAVRGGAVAEGSYVDVLFRSQPRAAQGDLPAIPETTVVLIEGAEVVAVEQPAASRPNSDVLDIRYRNGGPPADPTVTLAVTAQQAKILRAVEGRGEISLVPRAASDVVAASPKETDQLTLEELLGIQPTPPAPQPVTTEIYRRGKREVIQFEQDRRLGEVVSAPPIPINDPAGLPNLGVSLPTGATTANTP